MNNITGASDAVGVGDTKPHHENISMIQTKIN